MIAFETSRIRQNHPLADKYTNSTLKKYSGKQGVDKLRV